MLKRLYRHYTAHNIHIFFFPIVTECFILGQNFPLSITWKNSFKPLLAKKILNNLKITLSLATIDQRDWCKSLKLSLLDTWAYNTPTPSLSKKSLLFTAHYWTVSLLPLFGRGVICTSALVCKPAVCVTPAQLACQEGPPADTVDLEAISDHAVAPGLSQWSVASLPPSLPLLRLLPLHLPLSVLRIAFSLSQSSYGEPQPSPLCPTA